MGFHTMRHIGAARLRADLRVLAHHPGDLVHHLAELPDGAELGHLSSSAVGVPEALRFRILPDPPVTTHLHPTAELAERVLLPGDPGRALLLAQTLLSEPRMFNH